MLLNSKFINFIFYKIEQTKLNISLKKKTKFIFKPFYVSIYKKIIFFCVWFEKYFKRIEFVKYIV